MEAIITILLFLLGITIFFAFIKIGVKIVLFLFENAIVILAILVALLLFVVGVN